jgi:hypothetical protein
MITTPPQPPRSPPNAFKKQDKISVSCSRPASTFWFDELIRAKLEADKAATGKPKDQLVNEAILTPTASPRQCRTPRPVQWRITRACKLEGPKARSALKPFQLPYQPETL